MRAWGYSADHDGLWPWLCSWANAVARPSWSGRSRCNVVITADWVRPAAWAKVSVIAGANTGCGDNSTNVLTWRQQPSNTVIKPDRLTQVSGPVAAGRELLGSR